MKTYFIVNPKAGQGMGDESFEKQIADTAKKMKRDVIIYSTKEIGDAEYYVRQVLKGDEKKEDILFIACGGDGTLNEVLNGTYGFDNAVIGDMPIGTGNDFARNFRTKDSFLDIEKQFLGKIIKCDALKFSGVIDGEYKERLCANMFNIGFDCNVVDMTAKIKRKPFIKGSLAYMLSILIVLIKKHGAELKIEVDGKKIHEGKLLLTSIANGSFCGGGIKSNPYADVMDGKIDISVVLDTSRLRLMDLLPKYIKGTHLESPKTDKLVNNLKGEKIVITPLTKSTKLCIDGELADAETMNFEIMPGAFRFLVPEE